MRCMVLACGLLLGCQPIAPQSTRDIRFPAGFVLQTSRVVHLAVGLAPALRRQAPWVTVALPDGRLLSEGTLRADGVYDLRLPAGQDHLVVTARVDGAVVDQADLALAPGAGASVRLGGRL